ncbi:hypothetical protein [Nocardia sp. alder85J]|uniref:hypothetical protein n=1 Tax=Nocardia sp. alder85J TaxID=2862949 RepID=UPI001CD64339|nr:hypothetical protein [Nocardia sp. alder85J]MCX4098429.1 hypothetical protein [Nocardia sp. alder85J]
MSAPEGDDPGREFLVYLHTVTTQVTASAMRTRADRERRDRERRESVRNRVFDQSRARRDARYEADAARRAREHDARMSLHHARLQEARERLRSVQQARTFATGAAQTQQFQHTFDELMGSFAAAVATGDLSPEHAERARLLGEQLREKTGLDPEQVIADARKRAQDRPGWIDSGHEVTAELADRLVAMHLDGVSPEAAPPTETENSTETADRIDQPRVGHPPPEPDTAPAPTPSERTTEPSGARQAQAAPVSRTGRDQAGSRTATGTSSNRRLAELRVNSSFWRQLLRPRNGPAPKRTTKFVPPERVSELMSADQARAVPSLEAATGSAESGSTILSVSTEDGAEITEHIEQARVGEPPLSSQNGPVFVPSERVDEPVLATQLAVASHRDTGHGAAL